MNILANLGKSEFIMNAYLHVVILFLILSLFFVLYISKLTTQKFTSEINNLMEDHASNNIDALSNNETKKINNMLYDLLLKKLDDYALQLSDIQNSNSNTSSDNNLLIINNINNNLTKVLKLLDKTNMKISSSSIGTIETRLEETLNLVKKVRSLLNTQKDLTINDLLNDINQLGNTELYQIYTQLNVYYSQPDELAQTINANLIDKLVTFNVFLIVSYIVLAFIFSKDKNFHISHILIENTIVFLFIGIIEILFFLFIAYKYVPVAPSFLSTSLFTYLKKKLSS